MTKENGILTNAEVYKRPECGKSSNTMKVLLDRKVFTLDIGKNDCIQGQYSIGDVVEVLYCRECGQAILPESNAIFRYWLSLVFFAIPLYLLILLVFSFKKKSY